MINFSKIPFVRLLFPFVAGCIACQSFHINLNVIYALIFVFILLLTVFVYTRKKSTRILSLIFIFLSDVFLVLSAILSCYLINPKNNSSYFGYFIANNKQNWVGQVADLPIEKEKFYKTLIEVKSINNHALNGKVLVYFKKPVDKQWIAPGKYLSFHSQFSSIPEPKNPYEFNYNSFMANKGVNYQTFVDEEDLKPETESESSLVITAQKIKQSCIQLFNSGNLSKAAAQLCAALLTGYDDEINSETINAFAHSGTLHVLSVSGLHTGVLFAIVVFVLGIIDRPGRYKKVHLLVLLLILWAFVCITGFSPPVLRSAVMLSFLAIGKYYYNYLANASLNILAVSAFVILVFNPLLISDVGFLLSYTAVLGILLFEPAITGMFSFKYKFIRKIWQLAAVSIAAQLSTLPVTLYYFHQFPLWFVFSNLLVIPVCTLLMLLALLYLLRLTFFSSGINLLTKLLFFVIHLTDNKAIGYIDEIDFGIQDFYFLTALIVSFSLVIKYGTYRYAIASLSLLVFWEITSIMDAFTKKEQTNLLVYQVNKAQAIDFKNKTQLFFSYTSDTNAYNYHIKNNHCTLNYPYKIPVHVNFFKTIKISVLNVDKPEQIVLINYLKPKFIVFSNSMFVDDNFVLSYTPERMISDGSNKFKSVKLMKDWCEKNNIPFHSTRESGYFKVCI